MEKEDKLKLFVNEFKYISNENLRKFAEELIANANDYFFVVPASSSGKYHPQFDLGEGGLVRHTRCVAFYAKCVAESRDMSQDETDLLIISALAHDIKKQGESSNYTVHEHPTLASDFVMEVSKKFDGKITKKQLQMICGAVSSHMGKWGHNAEFIRGKEPLPLPSNEFERALQAADYIASRKEIKDFDFAPTEPVQLPISEQNNSNVINVEGIPLNELENYIITFGKHKNKTFKEVQPTGYLDWMCRQEDFFKKDTQNAARRYLYLLEHKEDIKETEQVTTTNNDDLPF
jgi:hypothetical protein